MNPPPLTPRERTVLRLVADGKQNPDIARELGITTRTASTHVGRILAKLDARTRAQAVARACRLGLLDH